MRNLISTLLAGAVLAAAAASAQAAVYGWTWTPSDGGAYDDRGGVINWIESTFDTDTKQLSWYMNFGAVPNRPLLKAEGFTLAINDGRAMANAEGELGLFYFDGRTLGNANLTVYGYNGRTDSSSHFDGTANNDIDSPDRMFTSLEPNAASWILELRNERNADRSRTMGFTIDASQIINYTPEYTDGSAPWTGSAYDSHIGVSLHTFAGLDAQYATTGYLRQWQGGKEGSLSLTGRETTFIVTDPVPEPASLLLLGGGLGLAGLLRRRRKSA